MGVFGNKPGADCWSLQRLRSVSTICVSFRRHFTTVWLLDFLVDNSVAVDDISGNFANRLGFARCEHGIREPTFFVFWQLERVHVPWLLLLGASIKRRHQADNVLFDCLFDEILIRSACQYSWYIVLDMSGQVRPSGDRLGKHLDDFCKQTFSLFCVYIFCFFFVFWFLFLFFFYFPFLFLLIRLFDCLKKVNKIIVIT